MIPLLLALLLALPAGLAAQSVSGRVVEQGTQQPVAGAIVTLLAPDGAAVRSVVADEAGAFTLAAGGAGEYRLQAQRIGYRTMISRPVALAQGEPAAVEVRLSPEAVALDPARVHAGGPAGIHGRVLDDAGGHPVAGATVSLLDTRGRRVARALTDSAGAFYLRVSQADGFEIRAQRVGYRSATSQSLTVTPDDTVRVEMRLATDAVLLAPLTVVAAPQRILMRDHQLAGFEWRREKAAFGRYMGPEEIRRINPFYATDVLQQMPFVQVHGGFNRAVTLPTRGSAMRGPRCVPNLYVDGYPVRLAGDTGLSIDQLVRGSSVAAVEVYEHPSSAPIEFPARDDMFCGVVVIWTRVPG